MSEPTFEFISRQLERLLNEQASFRDELRVQAAIIQRIDTGLSAMLEDLRAIRAQVS